MAIEIPDAALDAVCRLDDTGWDRLEQWYSVAQATAMRTRDRAIAKKTIEAALPHLIPIITADLRAQLQDRFLELDGKLFDVEEPDKTGAIAIRPMVEFDGWCAMQALEEAFDLIAGTEGGNRGESI